MSNTSIEAGVLLGHLELRHLFTAAATAAASLALLADYADVRPGLPHQQKIVALSQTRCVGFRTPNQSRYVTLNQNRIHPAFALK